MSCDGWMGTSGWWWDPGSDDSRCSKAQTQSSETTAQFIVHTVHCAVWKQRWMFQTNKNYSSNSPLCCLKTAIKVPDKWRDQSAHSPLCCFKTAMENEKQGGIGWEMIPPYLSPSASPQSLVYPRPQMSRAHTSSSGARVHSVHLFSGSGWHVAAGGSSSSVGAYMISPWLQVVKQALGPAVSNRG